MKRIKPNPHIDKYFLKPNKGFPNSALPVVIYRQAINLPAGFKKAINFVEHLLLKHQWKNTWQNGIYDFHHYHSNTHECMVIVEGDARVILGGPGGKGVNIQKGDLIVLPGGVGHRCIYHSKTFVCVGAYPSDINFDMRYGYAQELIRSRNALKKLSIPKHDPLHGQEGLLKSIWMEATK